VPVRYTKLQCPNGSTPFEPCFFFSSVGVSGYVYSSFGLPSELSFYVLNDTALCKCGIVLVKCCVLHICDAGCETHI
jgi:hypothetical protein